MTTSRGAATGSRRCSNPNILLERITTARISHLRAFVSPWSISGPSGAATTWRPTRRSPARVPHQVRTERMLLRAEASGSAQLQYARSRPALGRIVTRSGLPFRSRQSRRAFWGPRNSTRETASRSGSRTSRPAHTLIPRDFTVNTATSSTAPILPEA